MRPIEDPVAFIRANTALTAPPLVPELRLHLTDAVTPLWYATEEALDASGVEPPFWAFAWAGGQAVARYVLDNPDTVADRRVLDICAGSGLAAIAAALAGAARVAAADIDPLSAVAIALNAAAAEATIDILTDDLLAAPPEPWDVVLAGDVCYERGLSEAILPWLREAARNGALVLLGDPGRAYAPDRGLDEMAVYDVPVAPDLESVAVKRTMVWRVS